MTAKIRWKPSHRCKKDILSARGRYVFFDVENFDIINLKAFQGIMDNGFFASIKNATPMNVLAGIANQTKI